MLPILRHRNYLPSFNDEFLGNELLSSFFDNDDTRNTLPSANIKEDKDSFTIEVAAPGFNKQDFKINLNSSTLEISGEKKADCSNKHDKKSLRKEFHYEAFSRSFTLPDTVDAEKIKASYTDGILNIEIPKREEAKVKPERQIEIA